MADKDTPGRQEVAVIANRRSYAVYMKDNLDIYFGKQVNINCYDTTELPSIEKLREKHIVISAFTIFQQVKEKTGRDSQLFIADLTLNKAGAEKLWDLPEGTRALLVNIDYRSCMEVITQIYGTGFRHLELVPYYVGCEYDTSIKVAVTPAEQKLVPNGIQTTVDIGQRVVDVSCIMGIAKRLDIKDPFDTEMAKKARDNILSTSSSLEKVFGETASLTTQMETLIQLVSSGIIIADVTGRIHLCNDRTKQILAHRTDKVLGFSIVELLPELNGLSPRGDKEKGELVTIGEADYIVTMRQILQKGEAKGTVIVLDSFNEVERRQHSMRKKRLGYSHQAVYRFKDILGRSPKIESAKEIAMRMADSPSSIILYGESGTGKELFAQSIHNYSQRRNGNFVAVNCSALPEHLLESELYGYEEGAFSGAKKGGKTGLFELAHQGTIFLDEIGEIPLALQAKLLRVIEEKKVLRVGGMELIDVDVRIITATNRNLHEMVKKKLFRSDLYYRLNVLPIHVPSLRERGEDIALLFASFLNADIKLDERAWQRLRHHPWDGNVRELKNTAEYLANLGKPMVEAEDLPFEEEPGGEYRQLASEGDLMIRQLSQDIHGHQQLYHFILRELHQGYMERKHIGRNRLAVIAEEKKLFITQQEIKNGLAKLNALGFVRSERGRKGSTITPRGQQLLRQMEQEITA